MASLGFLLRDFRDNGFIHPTHPPPSISFTSELILESLIPFIRIHLDHDKQKHCSGQQTLF